MRATRDRLTRRAVGRRPARAMRALAAAAFAGALALTTACTGGNGDSPAWHGGGPKPSAKASATITGPPAGTNDVPASTEITFTTEDATATTVELKDAEGKAVKGALTGGGKSWLPAGQLSYGTTYTAAVTVTDEDGKTATASSTFTTMAKPANQVRVSSFLGDGNVVGVGMPLMVKFSRSIPEDYRDDVQRRMTVRATPAQEGSWRWISGTEVRYRPKTYWKANTTLIYKVQTGGLPMGNGWYGRSDLTIDAKIGPSLIMVVDNRTKQLTVTQNGKVIRTIPVSLGKPSTPSSSGTMLVMEKFKKTIFDTTDDPDPANRYVTDIEFAQRLTFGGEFIHAAPWSVASQGRTNVSHGCVNMSTPNASWLFNLTRMGDPITVKGTERKLQNGNGWTDWNMSWDDYVKGSAIPYEAPSAEPTEGQPEADPTASPGI